jgi:nitroreductase
VRDDDIPLLEGLMTTRAMRRFNDDQVSDADVWTCLRAAVQAPSGGNIQPYQFLVVRDPDMRLALAKLYRKAWARYEPAIAPDEFPSKEAQEAWDRNNRATAHLAANLEKVPVHVLVLMPKIDMTIQDSEGPMPVGPTHASVYPAVQNFILAARSLGLGTTLTTLHRIYEDEVRELCEIPDRYEVLALMPLGHPKGRWGIAPRGRPAENLTSWESFGQRRKS